MTRRIFNDDERDTVAELINKHGLQPKDIAEKWDTSTCVVYKQLRKWGVNWLDNRANNVAPIYRRKEPAKALKIIEVGERTLWPVERIALHCGMSMTYTKLILGKGLPEHYTQQGINLKEAREKIKTVKQMLAEGASRAQAVRSVCWTIYKYKYWLSQVNKKAPQ